MSSTAFHPSVTLPAARPALGAPITLAITALVVGIALLPGANEALELRRGSIGAFEWWRLFTGHLTHCGPSQLFWDTGTFALVGVWVERQIGSRAMAWALLLQALVTSLGVLATLPQGIAAYRGLSGIDSGLYVLAAVLLAQRLRGLQRLLPLGMLAAFVLKTAWEFIDGTPVFSSDEATLTLPAAHLAGAAAAAMYCVLGRLTAGHGE